MRQAVIFSFSRRGGKTACQVAEVLREEYEVFLYAPEKYAGNEIQALPEKTGAFTGKLFDSAEALVYVGACGIAVRAIAPYVKSKTKDPAVICVDECANFCIALLSGHIGGCNRLTKQIGAAIGATPVITTATDVNRKFAVDQWAAEQGYLIGSMDMAKEVSAAILEQDVPFAADASVCGSLPQGLCAANGNNTSIGILVSVYRKKPFEKTLAIIPPVLTLGIGCRRGTSSEAIARAVEMIFAEHQLDFRAVKKVASIDLKAEEQGLLLFCENNHLPVTFYTAEQLLAVEGSFTGSDFVRSITGVDNVCERSAAAEGGHLIVQKTSCDGVTVAVAERDWEIHFG